MAWLRRLKLLWDFSAYLEENPKGRAYEKPPMKLYETRGSEPIVSSVGTNPLPHQRLAVIVEDSPLDEFAEDNETDDDKTS